MAAATTVALGAVLTGGSTVGGLDRVFDPGPSRKHHALTDVLVSLGSPGALAVLTILLVVVVLGPRGGRAVWLAALAPPVASVITECCLKPLVERTRGGALSYPSGHTTGIFAIALVIVLLVLGPGRGRRFLAVRVAASVGALAAATAVAVATVAAGRHYVTDTIGGVSVATTTVIMMGLLIDAVADKRASTAQL